MIYDAEKQDDAEQQLKAIQEFMLGTSGVKRNKHQATLPTPSPRSPPPSNSNSKLLYTLRRKFSSALQAFDSCLDKNWLDTDDQLLACVGSIANLRERLYISSRALVIQDHAYNEDPCSEWKNHGYRRHILTRSSCLGRNDLELTLTDELEQHERMMSLARRLMASLNQDQEALGRRLDELLVMHYEHESMGDMLTREEQGVLVEYATRVEVCQQLFVATARELYRKQMLLHDILDSVHDGLMYREAGLEVTTEDSPRKIARHCASVWSRLSPASHLYRYKDRDVIKK
jgi:hypothetical protein